jgi:UDP-N-acetylglucosamine 3-dehydrogenase
MKVAVIGAGGNGRGHARCLAAIEGVEVVGMADPAVERAEEAVAEVGGRAYADHRAMLAEARPDAVWISSPCWLHAAHTLECAEAGAHIMCEKPMALSLEDCDRMIEAARTAGVKLMIGQSTRYTVPLVELKRIYESGRCGDLVCAYSLRMSYHQCRPDALWRLDGAKSGGIVFEWEVHEIDFVCTLGGPVSQVYAQTAYSRADAANFLDHFSAILTFASGGYGNLEASQSCTLGLSGRGFVGTQGAARAEGRDTIVLRTVDMEKPETLTVDPGDHIARGLGKLTQDADFVRAIREDDASPIPGEDGRANIEIGLAIVESGRTGQVVELPLP